MATRGTNLVAWTRATINIIIRDMKDIRDSLYKGIGNTVLILLKLKNYFVGTVPYLQPL